MSRKHLTLTVALLAGLGLAAPVYAQTAEQQQAQLEAEDARAAAAEATADALDAQAAATTADAVADATIGVDAEVSADVARQNAEQAAVAAGMAIGAAANASAAADDAATGHMVTKHAATVADESAEVARAAGADALFATRVGVAAAATPPQVVVPASPRSDRPAVVGNDNVTFSDSPGNSISPNYRIDFEAMDSNGDGVIARSEGRGNADLMREFHVVDLDNNGRLTKVEMKDWIDPLTQ